MKYDDPVNTRLQAWLIRLFIKAINSISVEEDRADVLSWLARCREVLAGEGSRKAKFLELRALIDTRRTVQVAMKGVVEAVRNYKNSDLPLAVKIAIPITLLAAPFIGGQGAGIAAVGGAVGVPALLLIFLGSAGITAILEAFATNKEARAEIGDIVADIVCDEALRQVSAALKKAMQDEAAMPLRAVMPDDEKELRDRLLAMDPFDFERHVMTFFEIEGIEVARTTPRTNDFGMDGWAKKIGGGLILVQCKRYAADNPVGRPDVQRFKGVIEEQKYAEEGYIVTTSRFTSGASDSAALSDRLTLVDMDELVRWHKNESGPVF